MENGLESPFVGREEDLEKVAEIFRKNRILGIFGKKGIGKSRLALKFLKTEGKIKLIHCDFSSVRKLDGVLKLLSTCILEYCPETLLKKRDEADDDDDDFVYETRCIMDDIVKKMNEEPSKFYVMLLDNLEFAKSKADKDGKEVDPFQRCLWDKVYNHIVPPFLEKCDNARIVITSAEQANILKYNRVYGKHQLGPLSPEDSITLFRNRVQDDDKEIIGNICELCDYQPDAIVNAGQLVMDEGLTLQEVKDLLGVDTLKALSNEFISLEERQNVRLHRTVARLSKENKDKLYKLVAVIVCLPNKSSIDNCLEALGYKKEDIAKFKFHHVMPLKNRFLIDVERKWKLRVSSFLRLFLEEHNEREDLEEIILKRIHDIVGKEDTEKRDNNDSDGTANHSLTSTADQHAKLNQQDNNDSDGTANHSLTSTADQHAKLYQQEFQDISENQEERQFTTEIAHNPLVPSAVQQETDVPPDESQANNVVLPLASNSEGMKSSLMTSVSNGTNEGCKFPRPETVHFHGQDEKHSQSSCGSTEINNGAEAGNNEPINIKRETLRSDINLLNQFEMRKEYGIKKMENTSSLNIRASMEENSRNDGPEPHMQSVDGAKMQNTTKAELSHTDNEYKLVNIDQNHSNHVGALVDEGSVRCINDDGNLHFPSTQPHALSLPESLPLKGQTEIQHYIPSKSPQTDNEINVNTVCDCSDLSDLQASNHVTALSDYQSGPFIYSDVISHDPCSELHAMSPQSLSLRPESTDFNKQDPPLQISSMDLEKHSLDFLSTESSPFNSHENRQLCKQRIRSSEVGNSQIPPENGIVSLPTNTTKGDLQVDKNTAEDFKKPDNKSASSFAKMLSWFCDLIE